MSALFGHIKGAFTGALSNRKGLLVEANQGLLFLDEIGELGLDEQAMLLRAIEDKTFTPFGSDQMVSSNFQLISGTNRNLHHAVEQGKFREDLLARINLWTYQLPSLKHRSEDIEPNIDYELKNYALKNNQKVSFNSTARSKFLAFALGSNAHWKANFRDLNSTITRMATLATGGRINESVVDHEIQRLQSDWSGSESTHNSDEKLLQNTLRNNDVDALDIFEQSQLALVIRICRESNSMADAGRKLFNKSRNKKAVSNDSQRLRLYLKKYNLEFKQL